MNDERDNGCLALAIAGGMLLLVVGLGGFFVLQRSLTARRMAVEAESMAQTDALLARLEESQRVSELAVLEHAMKRVQEGRQELEQRGADQLDGETLALHLSGAVVDAKRAPVAGADVDVFSPGPRGLELVESLRTRADGTFELDLATRPADTPASALWVRADAPGFHPWQTRANLLDPEHAHAQLVLAAGATIVGRVVDASGLPVAGAQVCAPTVTATAGGPIAFRGVETTTDARGEFRLGVLEDELENVVEVVATKDGVGWTAQALQLSTGADEHVVGELFLVEEGRLEGILTRADGTPAVGVEVVASGAIVLTAEAGELEWSAAGTTDALGAFVLRGLRPGNYTLTRGERGAVLGEAQVQLGAAASVTLELGDGE